VILIKDETDMKIHDLNKWEISERKWSIAAGVVVGVTLCLLIIKKLKHNPKKGITIRNQSVYVRLKQDHKKQKRIEQAIRKEKGNSGMRDEISLWI